MTGSATAAGVFPERTVPRRRRGTVSSGTGRFVPHTRCQHRAEDRKRRTVNGPGKRPRDGTVTLPCWTGGFWRGTLPSTGELLITRLNACHDGEEGRQRGACDNRQARRNIYQASRDWPQRRGATFRSSYTTDARLTLCQQLVNASRKRHLRSRGDAGRRPLFRTRAARHRTRRLVQDEHRSRYRLES